MTELSVALVNHNGVDCLPRTLATLARKRATEDASASRVDSGSVYRSWEGVQSARDEARALRFEENIGFCAWCDRAAEAAVGLRNGFRRTVERTRTNIYRTYACLESHADRLATA